MSFMSRLKYHDRPLLLMTRYSASRGILYSAPPGPSGDRPDASDDVDESADQDAVDEEAAPIADADAAPAVDATADD
jgi:hypothetical protein